jgi:hypothetical protein
VPVIGCASGAGNTAQGRDFMRKIREKDWNDGAKCAINEARPEGATNADEPLKQNVPMMEVTHMPFEHEYGDSAPFFNPEHPENTWKSIGELAARLVRK